MEHFELPHAKLLYVIYDLSQKKQITYSERSKLKGAHHTELVIGGDSVIFNIIEVYDQTRDLDTLYTAIVGLIRSPRSKPAIDIPPKAFNSEETKSPLDTFLQSRKKGRERYPCLTVDNPPLVITEAREEGEQGEGDELKTSERTDST